MMTDEQWQEIKTNYEAGCFLNADTLDQLIAEIDRLRAEVERLTTPKPGPLRQAQDAASTGSGHGFLTWAMQVEDLLPPGMAMGVDVEELQRWHEAGVTAEGAAERVRGEGP